MFARCILQLSSAISRYRPFGPEYVLYIATKLVHLLRRVEVRVKVNVDVMCEWMHHTITLCAGTIANTVTLKRWISGVGICGRTKQWLLDMVTPECCRVMHNGNKAEMALKTLNGSIPYHTPCLEGFKVTLRTPPAKRRRIQRHVTQQCAVCSQKYVRTESGARFCPHCVDSVLSGTCGMERITKMLSSQGMTFNSISV